MNFRLAIFIAFIVGFVSISLEIIWFSIIGFMFKSHAFTFGIVLSLVLFGIAFGAKWGYKKINKPNINPSRLLTNIILLAGIINFLGFPLASWLMTISSVFAVLLIFNILIIAGLLGCIFPILCHITVSSNEQKVGKQTSYLYAANILGATLGPLITGYILLDYFLLESIITILCILLIVLSLIISITSFSFKNNIKFITLCILFIVSSILIQKKLFDCFLEHLQYQGIFDDSKKFKYRIQNKSGTITVDQKDVIYGGGAYDGAINTDPIEYVERLRNDNAVNHIDRAYMIGSFHASPEKVLMIGLSSGSWAKVLADYSKIKELTIVEINPGYIELIKKYPEISDILKNNKVNIIIDDGRRWLKKNPNRKFDLIVMNTTFHWRQNSTYLLSKDFLEICKNSLNQNGVVYWNPTKSGDVFYTAAHVFKHVSRYATFVLASDNPFNLSAEQRKENFYEFTRNGEQLFKQDNYIPLLNNLINTPLPSMNDSILKENLWLITDDNMAAEYKVDIWKMVSDFKSKK